MYKMYKKECCPCRVVVSLIKGLFYMERGRSQKVEKLFVDAEKELKMAGDNSGDIQCWPF